MERACWAREWTHPRLMPAGNQRGYCICTCTCINICFTCSVLSRRSIRAAQRSITGVLCIWRPIIILLLLRSIRAAHGVFACCPIYDVLSKLNVAFYQRVVSKPDMSSLSQRNMLRLFTQFYGHPAAHTGVERAFREELNEHVHTVKRTRTYSQSFCWSENRYATPRAPELCVHMYVCMWPVQ
jgi:hypothetical protein